MRNLPSHTTDHTRNHTEYPHCLRTYLPTYLSKSQIPINPYTQKISPIAPPPSPKIAHSTPAISKEPPTSIPNQTRAIKPNHPNPTHYLPPSLPSHTPLEVVYREAHSTKPPSPPSAFLLSLPILRDRGTNPPFNVHAPRHVPEPLLR